jgi:predicted O-methyltransferase YrrM
MTRDTRHWTSYYLWSRLKDKVRIFFRPQDPWLTPAAIKLLDKTLTREMRGLEFGSGNSTAWFAMRLGQLTSVEHNPEWHARVTRLLKALGIGNVKYLLRAKENGEYPVVAEQFMDDSLDFILVDGILRAECAVGSLSKVKPGGLLVVDDVHRYLPSASQSPFARTPADGALDANWSRFLLETEGWESSWTTNGVKDTAIFYKPVE